MKRLTNRGDSSGERTRLACPVRRLAELFFDERFQ